MLLKLLKYDMKAVFRTWWFILPILFVLILIDAAAARVLTPCIVEMSGESSSSLMNSLEGTGGQGLLAVILILAVFVSYFTLIVVSGILLNSPIYSYVHVFLRFYTNLFTDEGYLTFTLPAKRSTVLLAKTLNAIIWIGLHNLILAAGGVFIFLVGIPTVDNDILFGFTGAWELLKALYSMVVSSYGWGIVIIAEVILLMIFNILASITILQFCFTLGSIIVKRGKLFAGIGVYYLVQGVLPGITTFLCYVFCGAFGTVISLVAEMSTDFTIGAMVAIVLAMFNLLVLLEGHLFYFVTRNCLERKLNLV